MSLDYLYFFSNVFSIKIEVLDNLKKNMNE